MGSAKQTWKVDSAREESKAQRKLQGSEWLYEDLSPGSLILKIIISLLHYTVFVNATISFFFSFFFKHIHIYFQTKMLS